jgi:hypothetical protein
MPDATIWLASWYSLFATSISWIWMSHSVDFENSLIGPYILFLFNISGSTFKEDLFWYHFRPLLVLTGQSPYVSVFLCFLFLHFFINFCWQPVQVFLINKQASSHSFLALSYNACTVLFLYLIYTFPLPQEWIQGIKMHDDDVLHTWFIFNLHTKISSVFTWHASWYLHNVQPTPCINKESCFTYLEGQLLARGDEFPSIPVTTAPPLGFYPFSTQQFILHYLHRRHQQSRLSSSWTLTMSIAASNYENIKQYV